MTDHDFFPPLLELSPDEIRAHKRHLLSQIARQPRRARLKRTRILVAAAAAGAAAAIAVALVPSSGNREPFRPSSARPPLAPFSSFHADAAWGDRHSSPASLEPIGDVVIPLLNGQSLSRRHVPRAVLALAAAQARSYGNRGPTRVEWVKTTRQKAVSAENAGRVDGGKLPVYFVVLHGHFVYDGAPRPPGAQSPRGRILTDTIEIKTGRTLDFGLGNGEPDFSKVGTPHHFVIYRHRRSR
jgi:hypothetical protein